MYYVYILKSKFDILNHLAIRDTAFHNISMLTKNDLSQIGGVVNEEVESVVEIKNY